VLEGFFGPLFGATTPREERTKDISTVQLRAHNDASASHEAHHRQEPRNTSHTCGGTYLYQRGIASWYGPRFHGRQMANGRTYNMYAYTIAHRKLPLGTKVCIVNPQNGRAVIAVVTDRGPYIGNRIADLSKRIADDLGLTLHGLGIIGISVIA